MRTHEVSRGQPYVFCLVLRSDTLVGAPIDLRTFDFTRLWFAEHCCMNEAETDEERALVRARCTNEAPPYAWRKRVLGACKASQYGGRWGLERTRDDRYYFLMDWWFAATPEVGSERASNPQSGSVVHPECLQITAAPRKHGSASAEPLRVRPSVASAARSSA